MKSELALVEPAEPIVIGQPPAPSPAPAPAAATTADGPDAMVADRGNFSPDLAVLWHILGSKREHASKHEEVFLEWMTRYIDQMHDAGVIYDWYWTESPKGFPELSNVVVVVADENGQDSSRTLFSCHVDTCHSSGGYYGGLGRYGGFGGADWNHDYHVVGRDELEDEDDASPQQDLHYDENFGHVFLADTAKGKGNVLGADDGVGVWICLEMIRAGVPGTYIFHRGEEIGCKGSKYMREHEKEWLGSFHRAIAFDRPNDYEVITHQRGTRGCSDEFGKALAKAFNAHSKLLKMEPSDRGVYTDTAEYFELIPECTNVGVGYTNQHSDDEYLDVNHAWAILEAAVRMDWEKLPTKRDPKVIETKPQTPWKSHNWQTKSTPAQPAANAPSVAAQARADGQAKLDADKAGKAGKAKKYSDIETIDDALFDFQSRADILEFVNQYPRDAARLIALLLADHAGNRDRIKRLVKFL